MANKPLVIGHRGAAGLAPENTLAAFSRAIGLGVDAVELDVLLSADGELMVHHDYALRTEIARDSEGNWVAGDQELLIKNLTADQLKAYDVGRLKPGTAYGTRFPDQQAADGQRIPRLKEVIKLLQRENAGQTGLWIEIKTSPEKPQCTPPPETVARAVAELAADFGFLARTRVLSFDWRALACLQRIAPGIPTLFLTSEMTVDQSRDPATIRLWSGGLNSSDYSGSLPEMVRAGGGRYWAARYSQLTPERIGRAHELGIAVYTWTVDGADDMRRLLAMGVDGIISNRPDVLLALLE